MNDVRIPDREDLRIWISALYKLPALGAYLPLVDDAWFEEMRSCFEVAMLHPDSRNDVSRAAAAIFYKITKNHYRVDGNKRSAVITTYLFFFINNCRLTIAWEDVYELARTVAESKQNAEVVIGRLYAALRAACEPGPGVVDAHS